MYTCIEIIGTIAFAVSGALIGIESNMDLLGVVSLGLTTACGGGILRDVLIGQTPPIALKEPIYAFIAIVTSLIVFVPLIRKRIIKNNLYVQFFDAIGLGLFTIVGTTIGSNYGGLFLQIFLGVITGCGGGILRDIFATRKPMIFTSNFYAVASIIGSIVCYILSKNSINLGIIVGMSTTILLRLLAIKYNWQLPKAKKD